MNEFSRLINQNEGENPLNFNPKDIFLEARKNPDGFLKNNIEIMKKGFSRENFASPEDKADIAILIPAHNETIGDKAGNLYANLYALSQQRLLDPDLKVKVIIVAHNCDDEDKRNLSRIKDELKKLEIIYFDSSPPLRGFSFPLTVGVLSLGDDEVKEIGIIDADTVVNSHWIINMHQRVNEDENIGAVVGPREYYNKKGNPVLYGQVKHLLESIFSRHFKSFVKLVTGNSFYKFDKIQKIFSYNPGRILTDGHIQRELKADGIDTVYCEGGFAVSYGEKFDVNQGFLKLIKTVTQKFRATFLPEKLLPPSIHIDFIRELGRYFPDLQSRIENQTKNQNEEQLLNNLMEILKKFDQDCKNAFQNGNYVSQIRDNRPYFIKRRS